MITELNELSDIGDELGKTLSQLSGTARYSRKSNGLDRL